MRRPRSGAATGLALALALTLFSLAARGPVAGPAPASASRKTERVAVPAMPASVREAVALQIALEAAGYSPGLIDGSPGPRTRTALTAFQEASGLPPTGCADAAALERLGVDPDAAFCEMAITEADLHEVDPPPKDWIERSRKRRLLYPSLANLAAERAHTSERFMAALNAGRDLAALTAGDRLIAPAVRPVRRFPGPLERIEIDLERKLVLLFARGCAPPSGLLHCSIAADPANAIPGDSRVARVAADPVYTFDPAKWPEVKGVDRLLRIPPGPRSPVGLRWIGLELDGVGIHGVPEPEMIGKTGSHGCYRLTNWDAIWLAALVQVGTPVRIVRTTAESSWRRGA